MASGHAMDAEEQPAVAPRRVPPRPQGGDGVPAAGLTIFRASRLEALVAPLHELLAATCPDDPLDAQTVVAAHPGMKQWLTGALARHVGTAGVVANVDVLLPSDWLDRLAQEELGERAVALARYQRRHLRWTLHRLIAAGALGSAPEVAAYLQGGDPAEIARRRFQLADRLASLYSRYLVYRPDWIRAWGEGRTRAAGADAPAGLQALETGLFAPLWAKVAAALGPHRAAMLARLVERLQGTPSARPPLHVFGLSHLPPAEMEVLRAYARRAPVLLYVPDPCREYWGGLVARDSLQDWAGWREAEARRIDAAGEGEYWQEQGHPLLARWGRMGQHFFAALADGEVREDTRHWQDQQPAPAGDRLARLQESLRALRPQQMEELPAKAASCTDASLRIHACHTRLRELEVLRDALLDAIERDGVRAHEIVVMAPDITCYAPLVPSVFGEPGSARERLLPYHLADVPVSRTHALFHTFQRLLELAGSRISTPEVVDFLSVAEVRRRLGLDAEGLDTLVAWLRQSHVAWGLDGRHRGSFGVPPAREHSFAWAMDRMLAGYLLSDAPEDPHAQPVRLPDGTELLPLAGIHGPSAEALGALDVLLVELQRWHDLAGSERTASAWATLLQERIEALFRIDRRDAAARSALDALRKLVAGIGNEPADAGEDPLLHFAVVRELLADALDSVPERQRFLMGGVTFCGMVPQRAIPFRVVCVLGLDEGAFPRSQSDGGLDLMRRLRRIGDREVRTDDRYLFLETVMSARTRLHLSYMGEGAKDGKRRNPAAPLAELMAELDRAAGLQPGAGDEQRPWLLRHPLQPFDARYFDGGDLRLFSYQQRFAGMVGEGTQPTAAFRRASPLPPDALPRPLPLQALARYYRDPSATLLRQRLHLSLAALDEDALPDTEPLDPALGPRHGVARRVFFEQALPARARGERWDHDMPAWVRLSGILPPGDLGDAAWSCECRAVDALLAALSDWQGMAPPVGDLVPPLEVDLTVPSADPAGESIRIAGALAQVHPLHPSEGDGLQLVRAWPEAKRGGLKPAAEFHFADRIPLFLDWAALRLHSAAQCLAAGGALPAVRLVVLADGGAQLDLALQLRAWDDALCSAQPAQRDRMLQSLQASLAGLVQFWHEAQQSPPLYFPRTSWVALAAFEDAAAAGSGDPGEAAAAAAAAAWDTRRDGGQPGGERNYAPGYSALLSGGLAFDGEAADGAALHELLATARMLAGLLALPLPGESGR